MKEFEWTFSSANYIDVRRINNVSSAAHFTYNDRLKMTVTWTTESFTEREWAAILACVKQAKDTLKKIKRL